MNNNNYNMVGIDVSKLTLDVCNDGNSVRRYLNNAKGYRKIISTLQPNSWCVMESTSTYGYRLADYLAEQDFKVSIVNPLSVKRYAQMTLSRTKTDKASAKLIANYAEIADLPDYKPASDAINELKQLQAVIGQLIKQRTAFKNQMEALKQLPRPSKSAIKAIETIIKANKKQIKAIEQQMAQKAQEDCPEAYEKALSVKGIGIRSATLLMAITHGFTQFDSPKKLSAYIGVCPRISQSGTSVNAKSHICKMGMADVRATLYMCAHSAVKYNTACKALYERLIAKGKAKKVALIGVVNKLIHQVFACVTKNEFFNNNYQVSLGI